MLDNAVAYYRHLRSQEVLPGDAVKHAVQRFDVSEKDLRARVSGRVADHDATIQALSDAKRVLTSLEAIGYGDGRHVVDALRSLYNAVTGESL